MLNNFIKLTENFKFNFDIDQFISKFDGDRIDTTTQQHDQIYFDPTGILHWQYYPNTKTRFARNIYYQCRGLCDQIAQSLTIVQQSMIQTYSESNQLIDKFLKDIIDSRRVTFIKQQAGISVDPHFDRGRSTTINIGLKNSNTARTYVSDSSQSKNFEKLNLESYVMNDGDVYLLKTENSHCVESLVTADSNLDRYLISYSIDPKY